MQLMVKEFLLKQNTFSPKSSFHVDTKMYEWWTLTQGWGVLGGDHVEFDLSDL